MYMYMYEKSFCNAWLSGLRTSFLYLTVADLRFASIAMITTSCVHEVGVFQPQLHSSKHKVVSRLSPLPDYQKWKRLAS